MVGTVDGIPMNFSSLNPPYILVTDQTTQAENGIYTPGPTGGASVAVNVSYDGAGSYIKTGLTVGRLYYFTQISPGERCSNGTVTLTESGALIPSVSGTLQFLNGASGATNANLLNEAKLLRSSLFDQPNEFPMSLVARVLYGTDANKWYALTSVVSIIGSSAITFAQSVVAAITAAVNSVSTFDNTGPTTITPSRATAFDNTSASAITVPPFH